MNRIRAHMDPTVQLRGSDPPSPASYADVRAVHMRAVAVSQSLPSTWLNLGKFQE